MGLVAKVRAFSTRYPLVRGMAAYAVIWPTSCICQQLIAGRETLDFAHVARFGLYGACFVAPTLHTWLAFAQRTWPGRTIRATLSKALLEQISYTPFAMVCFYFGMTLLEGKGVDAAIQEVHTKFLPTYKVGALVWPVVQVVNYTFVPEKNRVPFVSICSFLWACFLAYMKQLEAERLARSQGLLPRPS